MAKIYTRTGDEGETGAADGRRERKDSARVEANGTIDELNSAVGLVRAWLPTTNAELDDILSAVQHDLFRLGSHIAGAEAGRPRLTAADVKRLEDWIDRATDGLTPLRQFILPGGCPAAAALHLARSICRRAERCLVAFAADRPVAPEALAYANRLSDLLFVLARQANQHAGVPDVPWTHTQ
jgi:cob(I)alamin adenosyltransferase